MVFAFTEFDHAIGQCEQREITTHTDIKARMVYCSALTDDDVSGDSGLTAEDFYAKALALRVTAVFYAAFPFFVCHIL